MSDELKKVEDEIKEMSKVLEMDVGAVTDPPVISTDPPAATEPPTDGDQTDPPATNAPSATDAPATDSPATNAPATEPPIDYESEYKRIQAENEELKSKKAPDPTSPPATEAPFEERNFLDGIDDIDEVVRDPDKLNSLLNKVFKAGVDTIKSNTSKINETIPDIVKKNITLLTEVKKEGDKFFEENEDLLPWRKAVSKVFEELFEKNPKKKYTELMSDAADETRKRLNIEKGEKKGKKKKVPPKLPGKKRSSKPSDDDAKTGFDKELDEMEKSLNEN